MADSRIVELAKQIASGTEKLDNVLRESNALPLSLGVEAGTTAELPADNAQAQMLKEMTLGAARELTMLLEGPARRTQNLAASEYDVAVLHVIHRFKIARMFGIHDQITFKDIASKCSANIGEHQIRRILRYAMSNGLFREVSPGVVAHTAFSRALAEDPAALSEAGQLTDEQFRACAHLVEALGRYGDSAEPTESGWSLANRATKPMYEELVLNHKERATQFGRYMDVWATQHPVGSLAEYLAQLKLKKDAHVVDMGGNKGQISAALASSLPGYHFTVQDLLDYSPEKEVVPATVRDRIDFMTHNFFTTPQPVRSADVYLLRSVFHNWSDKYCIQILQNLIPALTPGSRVILHELCMAEGKFVPPIERVTRGIDLVMMSLFNGAERREEDFKSIFVRADPRFTFVGAFEPPVTEMGVPIKGLFSVIEAVWSG